MMTILIPLLLNATLTPVGWAPEHSTHHLCEGLYAHQDHDTSDWKLWRSVEDHPAYESYERPPSMDLDALMSEFCEMSHEHPKVHEPDA